LTRFSLVEYIENNWMSVWRNQKHKRPIFGQLHLKFHCLYGFFHEQSYFHYLKLTNSTKEQSIFIESRVFIKKIFKDLKFKIIQESHRDPLVIP